MFSRKWDHPHRHRYQLYRLKLNILHKMERKNIFPIYKCTVLFFCLCRVTFPQWTYVPTHSYWTLKPRQPCCKLMPSCKCRCSLFQRPVTDGSAQLQELSFIKFCLFFLAPPQDGSKRCKPAQRLHAAHARTATCSEPVPGAARTQGPFGERHATGAHHVLGCGPEEAAKGESVDGHSSVDSPHILTPNPCASPRRSSLTGRKRWTQEASQKSSSCYCWRSSWILCMGCSLITTNPTCFGSQTKWVILTKLFF